MAIIYFFIFFFLFLMKRICADIQIASSDFSSTTCDTSDVFILKDKYYHNECSGQNSLPTFEWIDSNSSTKSYVVTIIGLINSQTKIHFLAWNIPEYITTINSSTNFDDINATVGINMNSNQQYDGPCLEETITEPECLKFTIYALGSEHLDLSEDANYFELMSYIRLKSKTDHLVLDTSSVYAIALSKRK